MLYGNDNIYEIIINESINDNELTREEDKKILVVPQKYDKKLHSSLDCIICTDSYIENELVCVLSCNHFFHEKCIEEWIKYKNECPICRTNIPII